MAEKKFLEPGIKFSELSIEDLMSAYEFFKSSADALRNRAGKTTCSTEEELIGSYEAKAAYCNILLQKKQKK